MNCAIGQIDICSKDGCSWFKVFGYRCEDRHLHPKDAFLYVKKFPKNTPQQGVAQSKRKKVYDSENGICYLCGKKVRYTEMTIDHVIPRSKGGSNKLENLKPTHKSCNFIKADKIIKAS